jgi:HAD superfamily hydrolase (TIGR01509 family)
MPGMSFGAVFDWDGVIIDSSVQHEESWKRLATEEGKPLPEGHFKRSFGMKNELIIPGILRWADDPAEVRRLSLRKEELYRIVAVETGIRPLDGVVPFLSALAVAKIPCAIGSSTHRLNIDTLLDAMGVRSYFREIVSAEDVSHGKPDPEVFQLAAGRIGFRPDQCVVFEDAHVGIEAGLAGGFKVVAVAGTHPRNTLEDAHRIVDRLDELSAGDLAELVAGN